MGRVKKIGGKHPCGTITLDDFTKISSHEEGDCNINRGSKLFSYQKIEPFDKIAYLNLKRQLIAFHWFDERNCKCPEKADSFRLLFLILSHQLVASHRTIHLHSLRL